MESFIQKAIFMMTWINWISGERRLYVGGLVIATFRYVGTVWAIGWVISLTMITGDSSCAFHARNWLYSEARAFVSRAVSWLAQTWTSCWESVIQLASSSLNWVRLDSHCRVCRLINSRASQSVSVHVLLLVHVPFTSHCLVLVAARPTSDHQIGKSGAELLGL